MHILSIAEAIHENNSKFMWLLATIRSSKSQGQNVPSVQGRRPHQIRELAQKQRDSEHQDSHEVISRNKPVFHPYLSRRSLTGYEYKKSQQHIITTKTRVKHCPVMSIAITPHVLVSQPRLPTRYANQTIMFFFEAWVFQCLYLVASPHFGYKTHASQPESHSMPQPLAACVCAK